LGQWHRPWSSHEQNLGGEDPRLHPRGFKSVDNLSRIATGTPVIPVSRPVAPFQPPACGEVEPGSGQMTSSRSSGSSCLRSSGSLVTTAVFARLAQTTT
jgi:hypothetical protein